MNRPNASWYSKYGKLAVAAVLSISAGLVSAPTRASVPEQILIDGILGNSSELIIRRSGRRESAQIGSILQRIRDALITAPPNNARAMLRFLSDSGEDLNFYIQTNPHSEAAIYYFPCQIQGGDYLIGWGLAETEDRGCENGLRVTRGTSASTHVPDTSLVAAKQLAQAPARQISYCTAMGSNGQIELATSSSGDPCSQAIEQCQATDSGPCEVAATGFWWTSEAQLQATLQCADSPPLSIEATGADLEAQLQSLLTQTQGTDCGLQVYKPQDFLIVPAPDNIVSAQGDDEILVQTRDTGTELQVDVLKGAINVQTGNLAEPELVTTGERYIHSDARSEVTSFDREDALNSVNVEVLCAFASQSHNTLRVSTCSETNSGFSGTPIAFCNLEQASGGQEGDRRTIQMSTNQGEIVLEYEMLQVPDRLQILYEGQELLDTGFVSGTQELTVPFAGKSSRVDVIVTGNIETATTEWNYTLRCP